MQEIKASYIFHRNEQRIRLQFENYAPLSKLIRSIAGARWSNTFKSWHIPCNDKLYKSFKNSLPGGCILNEIKETGKANPLQLKTSSPPATKNVTVKTAAANRKAVAVHKYIQQTYTPKTSRHYSSTCNAYN